MLVYFRNKMNNTGRATFSRGELSLILGLYSAQVQKGEWRDYAIDSLPDMAVFSVYRSSRENPLYSIAKYPSRNMLKPPRYVVFAGNETLCQSASLSDVLDFFTEKK